MGKSININKQKITDLLVNKDLLDLERVILDMAKDVHLSLVMSFSIVDILLYYKFRLSRPSFPVTEELLSALYKYQQYLEFDSLSQDLIAHLFSTVCGCSNVITLSDDKPALPQHPTSVQCSTFSRCLAAGIAPPFPASYVSFFARQTCQKLQEVLFPEAYELLTCLEWIAKTNPSSQFNEAILRFITQTNAYLRLTLDLYSDSKTKWAFLIHEHALNF